MRVAKVELPSMWDRGDCSNCMFYEADWHGCMLGYHAGYCELIIEEDEEE